MRIIICISVLFLSVVLFKKAAGSLKFRNFNILNMTFYFLLFFQYIGAALLYCELIPSPWWLSKVDNIDKIVIKGFFSVSFVMIFLPIFIIGFNLLFKIKKRQKLINYSREWSFANDYKDSIIFQILLFFTFINIVSFYIILKLSPEIPIIGIFTGKTTLLGVLRLNAKSSSFIFNFYRLFITNYFSQILTIICYSYFLMTSKKKYKRLLFVNIAILCFLLIYTLAKAPIISFLTIMFLIKVTHSKKNFISKIITIVCFFIIILVIQYIFIMKKDGMLEIIQQIASRIFTSQYVGTVLVFDLFPIKKDFLHGFSLLPFSSFLFEDRNTESALLILMRYYNPTAWKIGAAGHMTTLYIAEAYANFGIIGVFLSTILLSFILSFLYSIFVKIEYNPITVSMVIFLSYKLSFSINQGLRAFLYIPELIIAIIIYMSIIFIARRKISIRYYR